MSTIQIKHRHTDAVLFEYQPTAERQASGIAMRTALEAATKGGENLDGAYLGGTNLVGVYLRGGCFFGSVDKFRAALKDEHGDNEHAQEYTAALELIACHAKLWAPEVEAIQPAEEAA